MFLKMEVNLLYKYKFMRTNFVFFAEFVKEQETKMVRKIIIIIPYNYIFEKKNKTKQNKTKQKPTRTQFWHTCC